ncbi:MAG TPA: transporter substrate-binding domain-containing protein, partial [Chloroflexota bacterium]
MSEITAAVRADLAPNGRLRVGINYGNAILARKDPATGESSGVAIQLAREIGRRLDAPLDIVPYPGPGPLVDGVKARECDLAFLGSDPAREQEISFTPAYMLLEATYLVKAGSPLRDASEVDREGISVGAPARANYELFLKRMLHKATLKSVENAAAAQALLLSGEVDAMAGLKEALIALA